jgi:hypothetical protein
VPSGGEIWLTDGISYKFVLKDSTDVLIATYDNITGINSNAISFTNSQQIITATANQTVFNLSISYQVATNSLSVFVDGVNQYGPGAQYAYTETSSTSVTFTNGLHVGAVVKFTTTQQQGAGAVNASQVTYDPAGTGAVATNVQAKLRQYISVLDFGADPTGVIDSTSAIQSAINAAATAGQQVIAYGTFKTSAKIVFKGNADFSEATFNVYGTPTVAVEVSTGSATNPTDILFNSVIWLPKRIVNMTKPATGWAGQGTGVRTVNLYSCQIFVGNVVSFAVGLKIASFSQNNAYNNYYLGHLENNKVNLQMIPGDATAATNENNFFGGRFSHYSAEGTNVSGTKQIFIDEGTNTVNNNLFVKPSLEGDVAEFHVENAGAFITIEQGRWEAITPKVLYVGTTASRGSNNIIAGGYNVEGIVFSYSGSSSDFNNQVAWSKDNNYFSGSSIGGIHKIRNAYSSGSPVHTFYASTIKPETATSTQWSVQHGAQSLQGKVSTDSYARIKLGYVAGDISLGDGTTAPVSMISGAGTVLFAQNITAFVPFPDNTVTLGSSGYRWSVVYAATGTINTSDGNQKQDVADLNEAEQRVAIRIKALVKKFRFKDAVAAKGDKARIHVGVIAQEVKAAFEAEGLVAEQYAMFCSDKLEDGSDQLGIRYEELLAFVISAI